MICQLRKLASLTSLTGSNFNQNQQQAFTYAHIKNTTTNIRQKHLSIFSLRLILGNC